jgi:hypothetical protein
VNEEVTLTRTDASFSFDPAATVVVGAVPAVVTSVAGDGSSIGFVPDAGATGNVTVGGVAIGGFALTLPAQAPSMTVDTVIPVLPGTGATATAPSVSVLGQFFDDAVFTAADITPDGGVGAQYYQFTLAAETTFTLTLRSNDGVPDLDAVFCGDPACASLTGFVATAAHDEVGAVTLPAGTHFLAVVNFDGAPTDFINVRFEP